MRRRRFARGGTARGRSALQSAAWGGGELPASFSGMPEIRGRSFAGNPTRSRVAAGDGGRALGTGCGHYLTVDFRKDCANAGGGTTLPFPVSCGTACGAGCGEIFLLESPQAGFG